MRHGPEKGSVSVFVIGIALITFAVAGLAVDLTRVWIYRRGLQTSADSIAMAAASELNVTTYYASGGRVVHIDPADARTIASRYGSELRAARAALEVRDDRVLVTVQGSIPSTFLSLIAVDELPVAVSSAASPIAGTPGP